MAKRARRAAQAAPGRYRGPLQIRVGSSAGMVGFDFGGPVARFGLPPAEARRLADAIVAHAAKAEGGLDAAP
jgi:hypothetical protein